MPCAPRWCAAARAGAGLGRLGPAARPLRFDARRAAQGPLGMDKLVHDSRGTTISNDGATIMKARGRCGAARRR